MIPLGHLLLDRYLIDFVELVFDSQHLQLAAVVVDLNYSSPM
jgi:hypothetical protein